MLLGAFTLSIAATTRNAWAHPYHMSTAKADLRKGRLEVTLEVTPEDLQEALRRASGRDVNIDKDDDIDALAHAYARKRFVVNGPKGKVEMTWVGCEVEETVARLYFEFAVPGNADRYTLRNAVFFEIAPAQVNRVIVRRGDHRHTLAFRATDRAAPLVRTRASKPRK